MERRKPKTVAESHAETTRMARRLFTSPSPRRMVAPILAFSLMEAFFVRFPATDPVQIVLGAIAISVPAPSSLTWT